MSSVVNNISNKAVLDLSPYVPGRTIDSVKREYGLSDVIKLGSNENPLGASARAIAAIRNAIPQAYLYPDPDSLLLRQAISEHCGVATNQIIVGNGSDNILDLMGLLFAGIDTEVILSQYAFANFYITARLHHATPIVVPAVNWGHDLPAMLAAINPKTRLIFLANPNNPTGTYFTTHELTAFLQNVPKSVVVVLDEAYFEFAKHHADYPDSIQLLLDHPNLIITRTFSKAYGLGGIRVGYGIAHSDIIDVLNRARLPFNVNTLGQAAATAALADQDHVKATVELCQLELQQYEATWKAWGLSYIPSAGNFTTVDLGIESPRLNQGLLEKGVIVRPLRPYGMPNHVRISIGLPEQNKRALTVLHNLLFS